MGGKGEAEEHYTRKNGWGDAAHLEQRGATGVLVVHLLHLRSIVWCMGRREEGDKGRDRAGRRCTWQGGRNKEETVLGAVQR